jgi:hypothetical protein
MAISMLITRSINPFRVLWARRKLHKLEASFTKKILVAEQGDEFDWAGDLKTDSYMETTDLRELCYKHDSDKLLKRADRLGFSIHEMRKPQGTWTHAHPEIHGALCWETYQALKKKVDEASAKLTAERLEKLKSLSAIISGVGGGTIVGAIAAWVLKR